MILSGRTKIIGRDANIPPDSEMKIIELNLDG